jgi:hypothetical protein
MLKARKVEDSWYPQRGDYKSDQEFNNIRQLTDRMYKLQDHVNTLRKPTPVEQKKEKSTFASGVMPEKPSIGPAQPPASSKAPGVPGQIAWDGDFFYVYVDSKWKRATLNTF